MRCVNDTGTRSRRRVFPNQLIGNRCQSSTSTPAKFSLLAQTLPIRNTTILCVVPDIVKPIRDNSMSKSKFYIP